MRSLSLAALFTCTLVCVHCGGAQLQNRRYTDSEASYQIGTLSSKWQPIDVDGHNDLAWHNQSAQAVLQVNASCSRELDIPLPALTNHLLIGFTERRIHTQQLIPMDNREALFTHLRARLDGQARQLALVVLKKDGCVYDFSLVSVDNEEFGNLLAEFKTFLSDFSA